MVDRVPEEPSAGNPIGRLLQSIPSRVWGVFKRDVKVTPTDVKVTPTDVKLTPTDVKVMSKDVEVTSRNDKVTLRDVKTTSKDVEVDAVTEPPQICPVADHVIGNSLDNSVRKDVPRWDVIKDALTKCVITHDSDSLQDAILSYNSPNDWHFDTLYNFSVGDQRDLFQAVTPKIISLALGLSEDVWRSPQRLRQGVAGEVAFTQRQIAALLANAFLCTYPQRDRFGKLPNINFDQLFQDDSKRKQEKLKCIFNYFDRVGSFASENVVTYKRLVVNIDDMPRWRESDTKLSDLVVSSSGSIEKDGAGMLQVDFANKFVGGGVLGNGLVQEEIRFVTNPELIATRLFAEVLLDNEALLMIGSECYSKYTGYSDSFRFAGSHEDSTPLDERKRRKCAIVAIDATRFRRHEMSHQFEPRAILRETNKAYVGFLADGFDRGAPVATGNWGCGAFNGDPRLKALLQLMAASEAGRALRYFTYGDRVLAEDIEETHRMLVRHGVTVGKLFKKIGQYKYSTRHSLYQTLHDWLEPQQELLVDDYSQRGFNADVQQNEFNAGVPQNEFNADVQQNEISQVGFTADGSQLAEKAAAKSCFEPGIETSPRTSTSTKNVKDGVEIMNTNENGAKVFVEATEDENSSRGGRHLHRNARELQDGTVGELVMEPQTSTDGNKDAPLICLWDKVEPPGSSVVSEVETPVETTDDRTSQVSAGVCAELMQEAMDVDDDQGSANVAEEREGLGGELVTDPQSRLHDPMEE